MADPVVVVGGGIVGLATAWYLSRSAHPVTVVEKEDRVAAHQSGRNSGVIHSGIYYRPGSHKATMCREGRARLLDFCRDQGIRHELCGKVIVAADPSEAARLEALRLRGQGNEVACRPLRSGELREREPSVVAHSALLVTDTGIVDYRAVCERLADLVREGGAEIRMGCRVESVRREGTARVLETTTGTIRARALVNCAGLYADRIARQDGVEPGLRIVPFRGHYHELAESARGLCRHLVYPVPDPAYPFLGVHFTRRIDGGVECGPNAFLAFAREGYRMSDVRIADLVEVLCYRGFRRLAACHWRQGVRELAQLVSRRVYVRALRRLIPAVRVGDLLPAPAGIRAQALLPDGSLADDFVIRSVPGAVHVCNAPSPAATAGLAIGRHIADLVSGAA